MSNNKSPTLPSMMAFPEDGFVALAIPREMLDALPKEASAFLVRIKSAAGFKEFMLAAVEAAAQVWPEIAAEWLDA